ncbi:hypothetical protein Tco_0373870 [Tanacetum coccineum]
MNSASHEDKATVVCFFEHHVIGSASGWLSRVSGYGGIERRFLSQKGSRGGRGVKEKNTPVGVASAVKKGVTPSVVDMMMERIFALGKSLYVILMVKPSGKKVNVHTFFTPGGNGIDVVVLVDSIRAISERFANTAYGFFLGKKVAYHVVANYIRNTWGKYGLVRLMFSSSTRLFSFKFSSIDGLDAMLENGPWFIWNNPLILKKWHPDENQLKEDVSIVPGRSSYAIVMIELRADVELKDNIVMAMPKITREGHYTCNYSLTTTLVLHVSILFHSCFVLSTQNIIPNKEYRHVTKKSTASSSGNKKKGREPIIEVSNSNPFDVLNSVDNDVEFGTNEGTTNLVNSGATSSGSSFMNVNNSSSGTTPIIKKIKKFEDLLTSGQAILVDKEGNPLKKVEFLGEDDSENEVASVDNDMARSLAYERGFGTKSLLEQWRDSYGNDGYDDDPYDDDMYEGQDLSHELQAICDNLDIRVQGRKKK